MQRFMRIAPKHHQGDEIKEAAKESVPPITRTAEPAGKMPNRKLTDTKPTLAGDDGNKAVHLAIEP
jgi:hypothetical protein